MNTFKKEFQFLIKSKLNINLIGPNGCGKTNFTEDVLNESGIMNMRVKMGDFIEIELFYLKIKEFLVRILTMYISDSELDEDGVFDLQTHLNTFLDKKLKKFYEIFEDVEKFFDNFEAGRKSICKSKYFDKNIYIIIDEIEDLSTVYFNAKVNKYFNQLLAIIDQFNIGCILISNFDIVKSELNLPHKSFTSDMSSFISLQFPQINLEERKDFIMEKICPKVPIEKKTRMDACINNAIGNYQSNIVNSNKYIAYLGDIINNQEETLNPNQIRNKLKAQVTQDLYVSQNYIRPYSDEGYHFFDALSTNQKILLISAFLAGETNSSQDDKVFVSVKRSKRQSKNWIAKSRSVYQKSSKKLKKIVNSFSVHRLTAIFASIYSIIYNRSLSHSDLSIEYMCDLNSLTKLGFIKYIKYVNFSSSDKNSSAGEINKKMICQANLTLIDGISKELGINLCDFVDLDNFI